MEQQAIDCSEHKQIILEAPPLSVDFQLDLPEDDDGSGIESLVDDAIVVPIQISKHTQEMDTTSLFANLKALPKKLRFRSHACTLAFAVTDYKLQGKTKDELIMSIAPRPFPPHLDLKGFYVDVFRVRARRSLRVLHKPPSRLGGLDHLYRLQHTRELSIWNRAYNRQGDWSTPLAKAIAKQHAKKNKVQKTKRK